jgi:xylulokinase
VGAGVYESVPAACAATIQTTPSASPSDNVAAYQDAYPLYRDLYPALADTFHAAASPD